MQMLSAGFDQSFFEKQSIETIRVIARDGADNVVAMLFIEMESADVVHRSFQADGGAILFLELGFGCMQQRRSYAVAAAALANVNGDDVASATGSDFADQKPHNA